MNDPEELLVAFQLNRYEVRLVRLWMAAYWRSEDLSGLGRTARDELMNMVSAALHTETMDPAARESDLGQAIEAALEERRLFELKEHRRQLRAMRRRKATSGASAAPSVS